MGVKRWWIYVPCTAAGGEREEKKENGRVDTAHVVSLERLGAGYQAISTL